MREGQSQKGHIPDSWSLVVTLRAELLIFPKPQFPPVSKSNSHMPQDGFVGQMKEREKNDRHFDRMTDTK